jgi:WD40 repeat protein
MLLHVCLQVVAVASDDGSIRCFNTRTGELICELQGHEDAVQAVVFDGQPAAAAEVDSSGLLISCGSDATFKVWS